MSVGAASAASIRARIWERIGNPLEWNDIHKVLVILSAAAGFLLAFLPRNLYLIDHPEVEPYISRAALAHMRDVGVGYVAFAAIMIPIGLLVQHTKRCKRVYLHVANQSWCLLFAWGAYLVGLVTSPMWVLYIMMGFFCLPFFDLSVSVSGMATCLVAIFASTLAERWRSHAIGEIFEIRIGINIGHASIGNFGSEDRMHYTAIGRHVNLAARLQASCEPGRILISHPTWLLAQDETPARPRARFE